MKSSTVLFDVGDIKSKLWFAKTDDTHDDK
jgi:hypothetical protein